jgi:hypothetical protein
MPHLKIPNQFGNVVHIHYIVLKTICSIALSSYLQSQMCTRTVNICALAPTYSSSRPHSVSSNTKLQGSAFYIQMATELVVGPLYSFRLLLKVTSLSFVYRVTVLMPYSFWISAFFWGGGACKEWFQNAAAAWLKQNPQWIITRYHMARLIGFAWNKAASRGVDVSAFGSTGIFLLNLSRVREYFFSISDTSETVNLWKEHLQIWLRYGTDCLCYLYQQGLLYVLWILHSFLTLPLK